MPVTASHRPRIVLTQRADVESYPPVLHQARILGEMADVTIVDVGREGPVSTPPDVHRHRVVPAEPGQSGIVSKAISLIDFWDALRKRTRPRCHAIIAFDPDAAAIALSGHIRGVNTRLIVHLHEHVTPDGYSASFVSGQSLRTMRRRLNEASLVVVADSYRRDRLRDDFNLSRPPQVVMNCPPSLQALPDSRLRPFLESHNVSDRPVVHFQGSIGPDHGLETTVLSMRYWPENSIFVLVGWGDPGFIDKLREIARSAGVDHRIFFVGRVPYDEVLSYSVGASVGLTLLEQTRENWRLAAGASNKRFEYAAIGLPQVTNAGPGIDELFATHGIAGTADPTDPHDIGRALSHFLDNPDVARKAGQMARALHLSDYNYEHQFRPVMEHLELA